MDTTLQYQGDAVADDNSFSSIIQANSIHWDIAILTLMPLGPYIRFKQLSDQIKCHWNDHFFVTDRQLFDQSGLGFVYTSQL